MKLRIKSIKYYVYHHLGNNIEKEGNIMDADKNSVIDRVALGKRIRKHRIAKKWTQQMLGEHCDITPTNISHIERAKISPSLETLVKIANALEIGLDELLCDSLTTAGTPIIKDKTSTLLSDCSDHEIKMIYEIISNLKTTIRKFN